MDTKFTRRAFTTSALTTPLVIGTKSWAQTDDALLHDIDAENLADPIAGTVKRNSSNFK